MANGCIHNLFMVTRNQGDYILLYASFMFVLTSDQMTNKQTEFAEVAHLLLLGILIKWQGSFIRVMNVQNQTNLDVDISRVCL